MAGFIEGVGLCDIKWVKADLDSTLGLGGEGHTVKGHYSSVVQALADTLHPPPFSRSVFLHYSLAAGGHQRPDWGWFILPLSCPLPDCLCNGEISFLSLPLSLSPFTAAAAAVLKQGKQGNENREANIRTSTSLPTLFYSVYSHFPTSLVASLQLCLPQRPSVGGYVNTSTAALIILLCTLLCGTIDKLQKLQLT